MSRKTAWIITLWRWQQDSVDKSIWLFRSLCRIQRMKSIGYHHCIQSIHGYLQIPTETSCKVMQNIFPVNALQRTIPDFQCPRRRPLGAIPRLCKHLRLFLPVMHLPPLQWTTSRLGPSIRQHRCDCFVRWYSFRSTLSPRLFAVQRKINNQNDLDRRVSLYIQVHDTSGRYWRLQSREVGSEAHTGWTMQDRSYISSRTRPL